ncbi:bifunctional oligoribonuclease/PAP phosphatase NrnA [Niabella terrae]
MGSALGLFHYLKLKGHQVTVISPTNWASWLGWMPGADGVLNYEKQQEKADQLLEEASLLFCLDFNIFHRTKTMAEKLAAIGCIKVLIDHHQQPDTASFHFGISDNTQSSTSEMVYHFIKGSPLSVASVINEDIARCLYAGVIADTGSFRFSATHSSTHLMVADLMSTGFNHARVHSQLYDNFLENRLRFIGHILSNRLEFFYEYNTALIVIPKFDLIKYEIKTGDTEGLVNYPLSVQGIKLAALVIDREEERKWSFRSKETFDCNSFARAYFNGGGHYNAAGGSSKESLRDTIEMFKQAIRDNETQLR